MALHVVQKEWTSHPVFLSLLILSMAFILARSLFTQPGAAILVDAGFSDSIHVSGLNNPTAMDFSSDERLFVAERSGNVRVIQNGVLLDTPFVSVQPNLDGERGLLGIAFDPQFTTNGFVYLYYTTSTDPIHNRVSQFTADPANTNVALAGSEKPILDLEPVTGIFHNGGAIHFGKDGKLFVATGDNENSANSQSLTTNFGKILRINHDGTIPPDNPFYNTPEARKEIWALGLRNPFTFAFSPAANSTLMYINDVGQNTWEEINSGASGANYGWPICEGTCPNPSVVNPIHEYSRQTCGAITGGAFYEASQFPSEYLGSYFFGDFVAGFIKRLPVGSNQAVDFLTNIDSPLDIKIGPDGSLYYLSYSGGRYTRFSLPPLRLCPL